MTTTTKHSVSEERVVLPVDLRDYAAINLPGTDVKFAGLEHAAKSLGLTAPAEDDMPGIIQFAFEIEARMRYMRADAMLAERAKDQP